MMNETVLIGSVGLLWVLAPFHSLQGVAFARLPRKHTVVQHSRRDPVTTTKKEVC